MEDKFSKAQFYERKIHEMARQLGEILDEGYCIELAESRSGLKIFRVYRRHEQVRRGKSNE